MFILKNLLKNIYTKENLINDTFIRGDDQYVLQQGDVMVKTDMVSFFFQEKPFKTLLTINSEDNPLYPAIIAKKIDSTYAHTLNVIDNLNELKLVSFEEIGRLKFVKLTEFGLETANILESLICLAELSELGLDLDKLYEREVKGRLREQMNKEAISKHLSSFKEKLSKLTKDKPQNIQRLAEKLVNKADDIWAEATGSRPG